MIETRKEVLTVAAPFHVGTHMKITIEILNQIEGVEMVSPESDGGARERCEENIVVAYARGDIWLTQAVTTNMI